MKIVGQGSLTYPIHCAQCDRQLIVSEHYEHCVKIFNYDGNFQYQFGKEGGGDGEFNNPRCSRFVSEQVRTPDRKSTFIRIILQSIKHF